MNVTTSKSIRRTFRISIAAAFRLAATGILFASHGSTVHRVNAARPNIIVIFTDDQGFSDLGCQEVRDDVLTPHIDRLAERGVRMTCGFVTAPQCMPSRVGILTGRYQQHSGVETNVTGTGDSKVSAMLPNVQTIASHLQRLGYTTGMSGKWGVGGGITRGQQLRGSRSLPKSQTELLPPARGFDEYLSGTSNVYVASHRLDGDPFRDAPQIVTDQRYRVEVQAEAAESFVQRHAQDDQPFFLYYAPYSPHAPFEAPERYLDKFKHVENRKRRVCLAMLACVDDSVGRIVDALQTHQLVDNTLIWFISDNGAPTNGGGFNLPFGGSKGSLLDGGVRVPFILTWPCQITEGAEYNEMVSTLDVMPTCLAAAGLNDLPSDLDGVDLLPFLNGKRAEAPHRDLFFRWTFRGNERAAIRSRKWKLIRSGKQRQLFNLISDPGERLNVADQNHEIVQDLQSRLDDWLLTLPAAAKPPKQVRRRSVPKQSQQQPTQ